MTDNEFVKFAKKWAKLVCEYKKYYSKNSIMIPDRILKDYVISLDSSLVENPYTKNSAGKPVPPSYDFSDNNGNTRIELKSSYSYKSCPFSSNQKACQRIIYINITLTQIDIYEIDSNEVKNINNDVSNQINFSKYMNNAKILKSIVI